MADPWWFRSRRFTKQVDHLDPVARQEVVAAVASDTRWYRRLALVVFAGLALGGIVVFVHDYIFPTNGLGAWRHALTPFISMILLPKLIMNERIDLVTSRCVRRYEQRDLRTEIATMLATRPS